MDKLVDSIWLGLFQGFASYSLGLAKSLVGRKRTRQKEIRTSKRPLLRMKGREQIPMMNAMAHRAQPVKLAHPGMRPKTPGVVVNSHTVSGYVRLPTTHLSATKNTDRQQKGADQVSPTLVKANRVRVRVKLRDNLGSLLRHFMKRTIIKIVNLEGKSEKRKSNRKIHGQCEITKSSVFVESI